MHSTREGDRRRGLCRAVPPSGEWTLASALRVRVFDEEGKTLAANEYPITTSDLPATLGLANKKKGATVTVRVSAWHQEVPLDIRDLVIANVPTDTTRGVKIILGAGCGPLVSVQDGEAVSHCQSGETCEPTTGKCDAQVNASDLEEYREGQEEALVPAGDGDGDGDGDGTGGMATRGDGDGDGDGDGGTGGMPDGSGGGGASCECDSNQSCIEGECLDWECALRRRAFVPVTWCDSAQQTA